MITQNVTLSADQQALEPGGEIKGTAMYWEHPDCIEHIQKDRARKETK